MNNLYDVIALENQIERIAELNEGEIPEVLMQELIAEQCKSVQQIENLCKYIRNLDLGIEMCDAEIKRINGMKEKAYKRIEKFKQYMTPYIKKYGKLIAGTFTLSVSQSTKTNIIDEDLIPKKFMRRIPPVPVKFEPDKNLIKSTIKSGKCVPGAELKKNDNLNIK
jgi:hypothetical protein